MAGRLSEKAIVNDIVKNLRKLRLSGESVWWVKTHGTVYGRRGEPDLDICYCGRSIKVEVKRLGKYPTAIQKVRLEEWASAGAITGVARCWGDVQGMLETAKQVKKEGGAPGATKE